MRWHQAGEALLTVENLRSWINAAGLVLFAPQRHLAAPAPTLVEAVLGAQNSEPPIAAVSETRNLLGRLVADGVAVPLNLTGAGLGASGDTPDFVVSAAVFPFIFTMRGDKAWKQPPPTSGPLKVSNLALATYQTLTAAGPLTAYDLATHLGKEVTEAACLRALHELWSHLRVIPLAQTDGGAARWELIPARYTKQIKAGANTGQPTALSALISLYLVQVAAANEDEVESFLSPLAPRSRIREVIHALLSARQLDTFVIDGKTLLHVAGETPAFASAPMAAQPEPTFAVDSGSVAVETGEGDSRITKYVPRPRKIGTGYLAKGKPFAGKPPFDGERRPDRPQRFAPGAGGRGEKERRPFRKTSGAAPQRRFDKPWQEDRPYRGADGKGQSRPPHQARPGGAREHAPRREFPDKPRPSRRTDGKPQRAERSQTQSGRETGRPHRGERPENPSPDRPAFRRFDDPKRERRQEGKGHPQSAKKGDRRPGPHFGSTSAPRSKFRSNFGSRPGFDRGARPAPRNLDAERRPPRQARDPEERRPRRDAGTRGANPNKPSGGRPFSKRGPASPGGKFGNRPGKKPFGKASSGAPFKPRKTSRPKPRRDESA